MTKENGLVKGLLELDAGGVGVFHHEFNSFLKRTLKFDRSFTQDEVYTEYFISFLLSMIVTLPIVDQCNSIGVRQAFYKRKGEQAVKLIVIQDSDATRKKRTAHISTIFFGEPVEDMGGLNREEYQQINNIFNDLSHMPDNLARMDIVYNDYLIDQMALSNGKASQDFMKILPKRIYPDYRNERSFGRSYGENFECFLYTPAGITFPVPNLKNPKDHLIKNFFSQIFSFYKVYTNKNMLMYSLKKINTYLSTSSTGFCGFLHGALASLTDETMPYSNLLVHQSTFTSVDTLEELSFRLILTPEKITELEEVNKLLDDHVLHKPIVIDFLSSNIGRENDDIFTNTIHEEIIVVLPQFDEREKTMSLETRIIKKMKKTNYFDDVRSAIELDNMDKVLKKLLNTISIYMQDIGEPDKQTVYAQNYFLGMLKATEHIQNVEAYIGTSVAKKDMKYNHVSFLIKCEMNRILIEFQQHKTLPGREKNRLKLSPIRINNIARDNIVEINIMTYKDAEGLVSMDYYISDTSRKIIEINTKYVFAPISEARLYHSFVTNMIEKRNPREFHVLIQHVFDDCAMFIRDEIQFNGLIDGMFHYDDKFINLIPDESQISNKEVTLLFPISKRIGMKSKNYATINFQFTDEKVDLFREGSKILKSIKNRLVLPSDMQNGRKVFSVIFNKNLDNKATVFSNKRKLNTPDVQSVCKMSRRRRKRQVECDFIEGDITEDSEKYSESENLKESLVLQPERKQIAQYVSRVESVCGKIQSGMMIRDLIGDLGREDWNNFMKDIFVTSGLISSSYLGQYTSAIGNKFAEEGSNVLGYSMNFLGGCTPKLIFDAYIGENMVRNWKHEDILHRIADVGMLTLDSSACTLLGLSAFGIISFSSTLLEIISMITTTIFIGLNLHETVKKVQHINTIIALNSWEETDEAFRAFMHLNVNHHIQLLMDEKQANILIFEEYKKRHFEKPVIKRIITAFGKIEHNEKGDSNMKFVDNNTIDLRRLIKTENKKNRLLPDSSTGTMLFCKPNEMDDNSDVGVLSRTGSLLKHVFVDMPVELWKEITGQKTQNIDDYKCVNAFGIIFSQYNGEDTTLYKLYDGTDVVYALGNSTNSFLIGKGAKQIVGGFERDTFVLVSDELTSGSIDGNSGHNTLDYSDYRMNSTLVYSTHDDFHYLTDDNKPDILKNETLLILKNITEIKGRSGSQDIIQTDCILRQINLQGGNNTSPDRIHILSSNCIYNMTILVFENTIITSYAGSGRIIFNIVTLSGQIHINSIHSHTVAYVFAITNENIFDICFSIYHENSTSTIEMKNNNGMLTVNYDSSSNVNFYFKDGSKMHLDAGHPVVLIRTAEKISKIAEIYADFSEKFRISIIAFSTTDNKTVTFGNGKIHSRLYDDNRKTLNIIQNSLVENHMIGNKDSINYFSIRTNSSATSLAEIFIPDTHIYCPRLCKSKNIIDVSYIAKQLAEFGDYELKIELDKLQSMGQLILNLCAIDAAGDTIKHIGRIFIIDGTEKSVYDSIVLMNYGEMKFKLATPAKLATGEKTNKLNKEDDRSFSKKVPIDGCRENRKYTGPSKINLYAAPIYIGNQSLIIIHNYHIERSTVFHFHCNISGLNYYRSNKTLIITNLIDQFYYDPANLITIFIIDFYACPKFSTSTLQFENAIVRPAELQRETTNVPSINELWDDIQNKLVGDI